jgi:hypothetical protein
LLAPVRDVRTHRRPSHSKAGKTFVSLPSLDL